MYGAKLRKVKLLKRPMVYVVNTIKDNNFVFVGIVTIDYQWTLDAIDATGNIKDNMPSKFARREALRKYPSANPPLIMPIEEWREKYGDPNQYKVGDIVK